MQKIILASQSPRRKQLLEWAEVDFEVIVSNTAEDFPPGLSFEEAAIHIARNKALAVERKADNGMPVLAADTIVICNNELLGKPADRNDAVRMLKLLSGNTHEVITAVITLAHGNEIAFA